MTYYFNEYKITDVKPEQRVDDIYRMLSDKYLDETTIKRLINNSICFGVYFNQSQIGLARIISDFTTVFFLCDLVIHEGHKNKGLEEELIKAIMLDDKFSSILGVIYTTDNHNLFHKHGFIPEPTNLMIKLLGNRK